MSDKETLEKVLRWLMGIVFTLGVIAGYTLKALIEHYG